MIVDVWLVAPQPCSEDGFFENEPGKSNYDIFLKNDGKCQVWVPNIRGPDFREYDVIVDGVFGAGLLRAHKKSTTNDSSIYYQEIFYQVNIAQKSTMVVSIDIPSGVCPSTGSLIFERPIMSDITVTFGALKLGLVMYPGRLYCGEIVLSKISFPPWVFQCPPAKRRLIEPPSLGPRDPDGHKGSFGKGLFISGSSRYFGAPFFCTSAFMKSGGGYATLIAPEQVCSVVASKVPEVVMLSRNHDNDDFLPDILGKNDVIVIGPGLGNHLDDTGEILKIWLTRIAITTTNTVHAVIIDGIPDAFSIEVVKLIRKVLERKIHVILTPHLGEAKRMFVGGLTGTGETTTEDWDNMKFIEKVDYIQNLILQQQNTSDRGSSKSGELIVVLKGSRSAVIASMHSVGLNVTGNSGMATAGSGDVLVGIIAAMICHGRHEGTMISNESVVSAVESGVWIHGRAGDIARDRVGGEDGVMASDIVEAIPFVMGQVRGIANHQTTTTTTTTMILSTYYPKLLV